MSKIEAPSEIIALSYGIADRHYQLSDASWQLQVFRQIEKDANMVGIPFEIDENQGLNDWYSELKSMMTSQLLHGDVRNFLYRIDVSEKKIRQIDNLSVDDLCVLVLEREFRKVCIRRHFSA